ncbi:MAG: formate dehydrogenase subunit delta [Burkholderiaceae bacterium]|jgi:formate dehydrogenase subunit delta|nr:formate dehydrogenase subunit delta [Burkholderiaceae bacterium]
MNQDVHLYTDRDNQAKLIRMAGEIAAYFRAYPAEKAARSVADHINRFWTPKMREDFLAAAAESGQALAPLLQTACARIKRKKAEQRLAVDAAAQAPLGDMSGDGLGGNALRAVPPRHAQ